MKVALGADHAGFAFKELFKPLLEEKGHTPLDLGCHSETESDYPDLAAAVADAVTQGQADRGIIICGTGIGSCIAANKFAGARAALCHDVFSAQATRAHNDSNILCLGARVIGPDLARLIVTTWLDTEFSGAERHRRRLKKVEALERK